MLMNKYNKTTIKKKKKAFFKFYSVPQNTIGELKNLFVYFISINLKICIVQSLKLNEL